MKVTWVSSDRYLLEEEGKETQLLTLDELFKYLTNMFREEVREIEIKMRDNKD